MIADVASRSSPSRMPSQADAKREMCADRSSPPERAPVEPRPRPWHPIATICQVIEGTKQENDVERRVRHVELPRISDVGTHQRRVQ